jgi:hypothetical protein
MKHNTLAIVNLSVVLIGTNAYWIYAFIDTAIGLQYSRLAFQQSSQALKQAIGLPIVARSDATPTKVVEELKKISKADSFEKDGFTWIGRLGLKFDRDGRVSEAAAIGLDFE